MYNIFLSFREYDKLLKKKKKKKENVLLFTLAFFSPIQIEIKL